ncbi:hypothetical protein Tco_0992158 [Tanacetum coccineum]|uniref:Uncharacterized protein n=1 Tax=Tanacetum coccineum TaxID=301880 RepID=A0ABQ5F1Q8_9ASTR
MKEGVPDVPKYISESKNESWGDNGDDESNDDDSDEVTKDDDEDDVDNDADEEEYKEEYMKDAGRDDSTQQTIYEQVKDDEYVILTTVHDTQKTKVLLQSSSGSSDFANQFLNLDNILTTNTEVISMMNVKVLHEEPISTLEKELSQLKQTDYSAQQLKTIKSQIPAMVDAQLSTRLEDSIKKTFKSYTAEFEKKAKDKRKRYIDLVANSITKSLENIVLAKSSSQPKSTYEAAALLTEFELKNVSLLESYGKVYSLKRDQENKDKDEDRPARSDQGTKCLKPISSGKSAQAEEPVFETTDTEMPQNQGYDLANTDDQPNVEAATRDDWFKKPERPSTPDSDWNTIKTIDFRPPQT